MTERGAVNDCCPRLSEHAGALGRRHFYFNPQRLRPAFVESAHPRAQGAPARGELGRYATAFPAANGASCRDRKRQDSDARRWALALNPQIRNSSPRRTRSGMRRVRRLHSVLFGCVRTSIVYAAVNGVLLCRPPRIPWCFVCERVLFAWRDGSARASGLQQETECA